MTPPTDGPSLEELITFLVFAEQEEASAVARELHLDPAVVSRRLKKLRTRYGLLEMRGKGQAVSERGREALPAVRALLRQYDQLSAWLKRQRPAPRAVALAVGNLGAQLYVARAVAHLAEQQAGWQVQVLVRRGRERVLGTAGGLYDLALVSHDAAHVQALAAAALGDEGALEVKELAVQPLCLAARKGSPSGEQLARVLESQAFPLSALDRLDLIGPDRQSGVRRQLERVLKPGDRLPAFLLEAPGWPAARAYARAGLGAAIVPLSLLELTDRADLVIRRLPDELSVRDSVIHRRDPGEGCVAVCEALAQAAAQLQQEVQTRWQRFLVV
jgi:DNA-binding transcriptional LysR family regulator